ncbi:MAG: ABC transporter ATP-binding protein [Lachnospiraceae bacterium]|nr:ABC transporter ATP-binding protein [Lachnospiraceae bacterium]
MKHLFELEQVSFTYAEEEKRTLDHISMTIEEGGFYLLCGRSGCGKSTLLRQLKSVLTPKGKKEGAVRYCGKLLSEIPEKIQCEEIGFVFQNPEEQIVTDQVWHELSFGLENLGYETGEIHARVAEAASYFGLEKFFDRKISELSGGGKQLLNLASVLVLRPKLLLLDEPFAQLDPLAANDLLHTLLRLHREMGITVLLSEHDLEEVFSYADHIFIMENGTLLAEGTREQIGTLLYEKEHKLFLSMPTPLRVSAWCGEGENLPYTVTAGQEWLRKKVLEKNTIPEKDRKRTDTEKGSAGKGKIPGRNGKKPAGETTVIELKNAWFRYGRKEPYILQELSLSIKKGEILALLGGNGAGKSTLLRIIAGFLPTERGSVCVLGKKKKETERQKLFPHFFGFLPQEPELLFLKDTVFEELLEVAAKERAIKAAEEMELSGFLEKHPYDLSCGEKQRVALAKVLLSGPEILLLDEPTKNLDAFYKKELGKLLLKLRDEGRTIILVSHDTHFCAEYADRAGLFFRGSVHAVRDCRSFFSKNQFYTTAAHRMAGNLYPDIITAEEIVERIKR